MAVVTMRQLLESGVHFGHQTRRWNPKMKRFIMTERNGIYIIDLQQSVTYINTAYEFVRETVAHGGSVMFAAAGAAAVLIAFLTVGFQSVKAALANPVKSLRSE